MTEFDRIFRQPYQESYFSFKVGQTIEIDDLKFKIWKIYAYYQDNRVEFTVWGKEYPNFSVISRDRIIKHKGKYWKPRKHTPISFKVRGELHSEMTLKKEILFSDESKGVECQGILAEFDTRITPDTIYNPDQWE